MSRARDLANQADGTISGALTTDGLTVDTNTLAVDASNNRVGIGTASPADQLELLAGSERLMIGANSPSTFSRVAARNTGDSGYRGLKIDGSDLLLNTESGTGNIIMSTGSDKVSIGNTDPKSKLHVSGTQGMPSGNLAGMLLLRADGSTHGMTMGVNSASPWGSFIQAQDQTSNTTNYPLSLQPSGGIVGVGTDAPSTTDSGYNSGALHVHSPAGSGSQIRLTNTATGTGTSSGFMISKWSDQQTYITNFDDGKDIRFTVSNSSGTLDSQVFTIKSDSKVGIGTDSPGEKLDVAGTIQIKTAASTHPAMRFMEGSDTRGYFGAGDWAVNGLADADFGISSGVGGKLVLGTSAGTARMTIDTNGHITKPNQPSFDVWGPNGNVGFNMIDGTTVTYTNWTTSGHAHNTGNHFNATTGIFTAPVAGRYFFNLQIMFRMSTSTYINDLLFIIQKNGTTYIQTDTGINDDGNGDGWLTENCTVVMDMAANDTAQACYALYSSSHGTGATTTWYSYQGYYSRFCGYLLG